jgi:hypothetical protein
MPALMTPKNAVTASNMTTDPNAQRPDLTARGPAQSKGFRWGSSFCRVNDDFVQQAMRLAERIAHHYLGWRRRVSQQKRQNPDLNVSSMVLTTMSNRLPDGSRRAVHQVFINGPKIGFAQSRTS